MTKQQETEQEENTDIAKMEPVGRLTFLQDPKKSNLAKVLKKLDKSTEDALDFLSTVMRNDKVDVKERIAAAKFIVERKIQVSDLSNKEMLARQVAESRLILAEKALNRPTSKFVNSEDDEDAPSVPIYTSDVILDVSKVRSL